ncbi:serine/threonine-protein kinase [Nocardioides sp. SYSU D00038]|uniref:serine/threonine-protein kinase n=1 Tax=Nocardioides sp. SYSU D00038 TaxID=2812554 RepID=UPI0019689104|nr:serine/threonine-protein kinase [Nocardioides sp. SYSU D00038]
MTVTTIADRYALDREIGHGGMGTVWLGRDTVLGRPVALKRVAASTELSPEGERVEREARLSARLNHPNVVAVFDLVDDGPTRWLVMEYVDGVTLSDLVRHHGPLPPDQAAPVLLQAATALEAAHAAGIVHRDVKPSNILVASDGTAKLTDFGIARTLTDPSLTKTGLVTGSPAYLAPEVATGRTATPASDVWSLGATLFHALTGHPPYDVGDNVLGAMYRIVHDEPPRPENAGWLLPLLEATMCRDVTRRWDAGAVRTFLEAGPAAAPNAAPRSRPGPRHREAPQPRVTRHDEGTQVLRTAVPPPPPPRRVPGEHGASPVPRRRRVSWLMLLAVAAVLVLVSAVAFAIGLGGGDDPPPAAGPREEPSATASTSFTASAETMTQFVEDYLRIAPADPEAGFEMLTPAYQEESNGLDGYTGFWGTLSDVELLEVTSTDLDLLRVSYDYRYRVDGGPPQTESVTLQLQVAGDGYLIAGAA